MSGRNWCNPGTANSRALTGSSATWAITNNLVFPDGICNTASLASGSGSYTNYLTAQNFGIKAPSTATILGVYVRIGQCAASAGAFKDKSVVLIRADNTLGATDKATATTYSLWANPNVSQYYGSSSDMWGETLGPTDVNNNNFGVAFAIQETVCFIRGTKIMTPVGDISIENLKVGNYIISFDKNLHKNISKVIRITKNKADKVICLNGNVTATPEHPFRTNEGFKKIGKLKIGEIVWTKDGLERVETLKEIIKPIWVYNLSVSTNETYFANGYGVHNKPGGTTVGCDNISMIVYFSDKNLRISGQ